MAKNRYKQAKKVFSISLGAGCRRFESCHSDHLFQKNRLKGRFFCVKSLFFSFTWPHSNCGQRGKMAALSLERKNAENGKIPNQSLTVGIMIYRRNTVLEIEFIHNVCYNYIDAVLSFISAI